jgi:hypothetical protein
MCGNIPATNGGQNGTMSDNHLTSLFSIHERVAIKHFLGVPEFDQARLHELYTAFEQRYPKALGPVPSKFDIKWDAVSRPPEIEAAFGTLREILGPNAVHQGEVHRVDFDDPAMIAVFEAFFEGRRGKAIKRGIVVDDFLRRKAFPLKNQGKP